MSGLQFKQRERRFLWMHMLPPPHSVHRVRRFLWMQMDPPPHVTQILNCRLCMHFFIGATFDLITKANRLVASHEAVRAV